MTQTASKTKVYVGLEDVQGVRAATLIPLEVDVFNENDKPVEAVRAGARGNIAAEHGSEIIEESSEVQLSGDVASQMIGFFLAGIYGTVASTADDPEVGVNSHDYSVLNTNGHKTFSILFADEDVDGGVGEFRECLGCIIDAAEFPIDGGTFGKFDIKFMGRSSQDSADPDTEYLDEQFFVTPNAKFKLAVNAAGLDAAEALPVQTGKLLFEKNSKKQFVVGSGVQPKKCYNGRISAKLEVTVEYESDEYIDAERDNTTQSARLELTSGATIGAVTNPLIQMDFENCKIRELTRDRNVDEELRQSFGIKTEDAMSATAKLINTKTSYIAD